MAKLKGYKKLNNAITAQFTPFGITGAVLGTEYSYVLNDSHITYKITEGDIEDLWMAEFVAERFGYEVKNIFIFSLLHEVGHHLANDEIVDAIADFCDNEKIRIGEEMEENAGDMDIQKKLEWQYFNLPDEIMATQWAVNYAKAHPRKVNKMWKECEKAFHEFYKKNLDKEEFI